MEFERCEWLETDGLGGFATGTAGGVRTRRYHALLVHATRAPTARMTLVNGFDAWIETAGGSANIAAQRYAPDVIHPDAGLAPQHFSAAPWPTWTFTLPDGLRVSQEVWMRKGAPVTIVAWRLPDGPADARLHVRPFLSGRDFHALHLENARFRFEPRCEGERLAWQPYERVPQVLCLTNGEYAHEPYWYRGFLYSEERRRGLDHVEDLAAPGKLSFDLSRAPAVMILAAGDAGAAALAGYRSALEAAEDLRAAERARRSAFPTRLHAAADAYIVRRGAGATVVAGYPWFSDFGRTTFIALRGLCIAGGRLDDARAILLEWSRHLRDGMLPHMFLNSDEDPVFNSVDGPLWFVVAVHDLLQAMERPGARGNGHASAPAAGLASETWARERAALLRAAREIVAGFARGARFGIRMDVDGLLACGGPGTQLTWMDAKIGEHAVTPRVGKPVEVQALWLFALHFVAAHDPALLPQFERARDAFVEKFWNPRAGCLYDVIDVDHEPGRVDAALRPNQVFAAGGLPLALLDPSRAAAVVRAVESALLTPLGLRSLGPTEPGYIARCEGGLRQRDTAAHQGCAWPWLLGAFVEAWVRVRGGTPEAVSEARRRFLPPLQEYIDAEGQGHLCEFVDGDPPQYAGGCPFSAWSLGELLRLEHAVLAPSARTAAIAT